MDGDQFSESGKLLIGKMDAEWEHKLDQFLYAKGLWNVREKYILICKKKFMFLFVIYQTATRFFNIMLFNEIKQVAYYMMHIVECCNCRI